MIQALRIRVQFRTLAALLLIAIWSRPALVCAQHSEPCSCVGRWLALLDDRDESVRLAALEALGQSGEAACVAVPDLVARLDQGPEPVRQGVMFALSRIGPQASTAVPVLSERARSEERKRRTEALSLLTRIGLPALPELLALYQQGDIAHRIELLPWVAAAGRGDPRVRAAFLGALRDPAAEVRARAAQELANAIDDPREALERIRPLLEDDAIIVRRDATRALGRLAAPMPEAGAAEPSDALVAALVVALEDPDPDVVLAAVFGIERLGPAGRAALPRLDAMLARGTTGDLQSWLRLARDKLNGPGRESLQHRVIGCPGGAPAPTAGQVAVLLEALGDGCASVRAHAAGVLARALEQREEVTGALTAALDDSDDRVRVAALGALISLQAVPATATPRLFRLLAAPAATERSAAVHALALNCRRSRPGCEDVVASLATALADPDSEVRRAAAGLFYVPEPATDSVALLSPALTDPESKVRLGALQSIYIILNRAGDEGRRWAALVVPALRGSR